MDKELCFCIEEKNIYLEQVLVDYMDVPIFFLCKGDDQYYVSLCTDIEELKYILVRPSDEEVRNLLHEKLPMRDIILNQKEYWEVLSGENISSDVVEKYLIAHLDLSVLPEENACFEVLTEDVELYVQKFDNEFLGKTNFDSGKIEIEWNKFFADELFELLDEVVEEFISLGVYSLKSQLNRMIEPLVEMSEEYVSVSISHIEKIAVPQDSQNLEKWKNDDAINMAA